MKKKWQRETSATKKQKAPEQTPEQKRKEAEAVAYSELLELAQRKFVHQVEQAITALISSVTFCKAKYSSHIIAETAPIYPRLVFFDLTDDALANLNSPQLPNTARSAALQSRRGSSDAAFSFALINAGDLAVKALCEVDGVIYV